MHRIWNQLDLQRATLEQIEARLGDGGGQERQPAPRKIVSDCADQDAPLQLEVWRGQEPAQRIANTILLCAIRDRASQVILEPGAQGMRVRFIIENGVREQKLPGFALAPIVRHFYALARIDTTSQPAQNSGSVRLSVDEQFYELRFSPLSTQWGDGMKVSFSSQP